jgi:hypothetical protein
MLRNILTAALASAAVAIAVPALAAPGGGGGGEGHGGGIGGGLGNAGMGAPGGMSNGLGNAMDHANMNSSLNNGTFTNPATGISQGPNHASANGTANANWHSVLAGTGSTAKVTSGTFAGLTTGMTIFSNGTAIGTVQQIRTTSNGAVVAVVVKASNGGMYQIPVRDLMFANGMLSTTARLAGLNVGNTGTFTNPAIRHSQGPMHASTTGIAHANWHSVLAGGSVSSTMLPGLTTGLTVRSSTGTTLGTISQVVTGTNGSIRLVVVTSSTGQTYRLSPSMLTISGGVVTTTQV